MVAQRTLSLRIRQLDQLTNAAAVSRYGKAAGFAAKDAALAQAAKDLGPDRAMSNLKNGKSPLRAGWEQTGPAVVTVTHTGPWNLADKGRTKSGVIYPRDKNRKAGKRGTARQLRVGRAVMTPWGPKASSRYGSSRGLDTFRKAIQVEKKSAAAAAQQEFTAMVRSIGD
jgi:hypothetical protein